MYYKIENKESEIYKKLYDFRRLELEIEERNAQLIKEKITMPYKYTYGQNGQSQYYRTKTYSGFVFLEPEKVDLKIWARLSSDNQKEDYKVFVPNKRTKAGREMNDFLSSYFKVEQEDKNVLRCSSVFKLWEILKVPHYGSFSYPFLEIATDESLILFLDEKQEPSEENIIEITKRDFYKEIDKINEFKKENAPSF